jgi:hypothetical protein
MAVGPQPNVRGILTPGALCASCGSDNMQDHSDKYQEYGGLFGPSGATMPDCSGPGGCSDDIFFVPSIGGTPS